MRQAILRAPRVIDLVEVPTPAAGPGEVLVRIQAALTCGTDLKTYRRGHPRVPFGPFGHEAAGDVVSIGDGVRGFAPGQPVVFTPTAPCGACGPCRRGRENLCTSLFHDMALGAYGDIVRLPARVVGQHLFEKPSSLSYIEAAFLSRSRASSTPGDVWGRSTAIASQSWALGRSACSTCRKPPAGASR